MKELYFFKLLPYGLVLLVVVGCSYPNSKQDREESRIDSGKKNPVTYGRPSPNPGPFGYYDQFYGNQGQALEEEEAEKGPSGK